MYNANNYYSRVSDIDFSTFPEALKKGHELVNKTTHNGKDWSAYNESDNLKRVINTYFEKLDEHVKKAIKKAQPEKKAKPPKGKSRAVQQAELDIKQYATLTTDGLKKLLQIELDAKQEHGDTPEITIRMAALKKELNKREHRNAKEAEKSPASMVERISDEVRFIRRFVNLNGKSKTKDEILRFINALQKAILEKKIRKTSQYAEQIKFIQKKLIETFNSMGKQVTIQFKESTVEALKTVAGDEAVLSSVSLIKRYINLNGKPGMKQKAKDLLAHINRAYEKGKIGNKDPYAVEVQEIKKNLEYFIGDSAAKTLDIEPNDLNGLQGIVDGCSCHNLNGVDGDAGNDKPVIMNSMDFANMKFNSLGLKGKWLQLIGDPSTNFTVMVYGKPKMGKSYLCVEFAGYLARNHGKVLYVAKEEGLDKTLQDKLNDKEVKHPNLYVASALPAGLSFYDFIFLDSVNKLGLNPDDLNRLKATYPDKSFIYIFQTTKEGKFRGANTFQHDVDSVIEVPERGKAVQFGRFNQGGEISIF